MTDVLPDESPLWFERPVRAALQTLTDEQLRRGMRAFAHPPRGQSQPADGDCAGCFCYEAFFGERHFLYWRNGDVTRGHLSSAYESHNEFLYGECVRELAERGVVVEPATVRGSAGLTPHD